jgi:hypothetical protein
MHGDRMSYAPIRARAREPRSGETGRSGRGGACPSASLLCGLASRSGLRARRRSRRAAGQVRVSFCSPRALPGRLARRPPRRRVFERCPTFLRSALRDVPRRGRAAARLAIGRAHPGLRRVHIDVTARSTCALGLGFSRPLRLATEPLCLRRHRNASTRLSLYSKVHDRVHRMRSHGCICRHDANSSSTTASSSDAKHQRVRRRRRAHASRARGPSRELFGAKWVIQTAECDILVARPVRVSSEFP